jgi:hypothetical protein
MMASVCNPRSCSRTFHASAAPFTHSLENEKFQEVTQPATLE